MKLLLTSNGLTTDILRNKFLELVNKKAKDIQIAYIYTSSNVEEDKSYVEENKEDLRKMGIQNITAIDISLPKEEWWNSFIKTDVIWFEGGNTFYLLNQVRKSGLDKDLKDIIKDKLYVGVSAGSIIATPTIAVAAVEPPDINVVGLQDLTGLNWVPFEISPHTNSSVSLENIEKYAASTKNKVYAYDDTLALLVQNETVSIIGDGFCKVFN